jgi:hypothetical protein
MRRTDGANQRAVEMHDHGLAQHIVVSVGRNAGQIRQLGVRKLQMRVARACFRQQAIRRIKTLGRKSVGVEPGDLAAGPAAGIGSGSTLDEEAIDHVVQIDRRRLLVPVFRKCRRIPIVSGERLTIHGT